MRAKLATLIGIFALAAVIGCGTAVSGQERPSAPVILASDSGPALAGQ
ncbi:hypothetical protein [Kitasatospora sp. GP82]|nr:hypothetical protein [Kitasatospora sp. GP82]MDH6129693.1 hypothetical protein [Kitasatospora sp. GP82]